MGRVDSAKEPMTHPSRTNRRKGARSERRIQLHVAKRLRRPPNLPYIDKHGRLIPNHPELSPEARARLPLLYILRKNKKNKGIEEPTGDTPWYPQSRWETTPAARKDTTELDPTLGELPAECQIQADVLRTIGTELHEHHLTKYGLRDLRLAQIRDVHLSALKKLLKNESLEDPMFPDEVQDFAKRYYNQKKDLLFVNPDDLLCVNYVP